VQRQLAQVVAAGAELHLLVVLAAMERVEVGDAIDAKDHRLAVEHAVAFSVSQNLRQRHCERTEQHAHQQHKAPIR